MISGFLFFQFKKYLEGKISWYIFHIPFFLSKKKKAVLFIIEYSFPRNWLMMKVYFLNLY